MEISPDTATTAGPTPCTPGPTDGLLACFQKALGHELPNQLVAVQGLARLLEQEQGPRLGPEAREQLARLAELTRRADGLVRALAELGRLCRDNVPGPPLSLAEVAVEAAAELTWKSGGPRVEYRFADGLPDLTVSRRALYQVLIHLLRNAAGAALPGRPARIEVGARVPDSPPGAVEFWVADDGRGLSAPQRAQLFEPFPAARADPARPGLGLYAVRQLVAGWGGTVRVDSEPGRGTRVRVFIPSATRDGRSPKADNR